jgi:hypothetical protein
MPPGEELGFRQDAVQREPLVDARRPPRAPHEQVAETARSAGRPTTDLTAYDLYLRLCDGLVVHKTSARGAASFGTGDRAGSALWACARMGRILLLAAAY